jgi:hypothetical protein
MFSMSIKALHWCALKIAATLKSSLQEARAALDQTRSLHNELKDAETIFQLEHLVAP